MAKPPWGAHRSQSLPLVWGPPNEQTAGHSDSAKFLRLGAAAITRLDNLVMSGQDANKRLSRAGGHMVILKSEETLEQIHFMLVLLCSKKISNTYSFTKKKTINVQFIVISILARRDINWS